MDKIKIDQTDIFLENFDKEGQGKITISDSWRGAFTYTWGAMGSKIEEFICRINSGYFADKLCQDNYVFDPKATVKNVRKAVSEELNFWEFMEAQKELRKEIKKLEACSSSNEFVEMITSIPENIFVIGMKYRDEKEFQERIKPIFKTEPWYMIAEKPSPTYNWLCDLHKKLIKELNRVAA